MSAATRIPDRPTLASLREAAAACTACELHRDGTQTVFGEGARDARVMLVGEQPGDREDRQGRPFAGPAGRVLRDAMAETGIDPETAYITNVVKHFRHRTRGKRRIHQKPEAVHIAACRPWLDAELAVVDPQALVCLGATAAQALLGRDVRVTRDRGRVLESDLAPLTMVTVHPSSILRAGGDAGRRAARETFVDDLRALAAALDDG